MTRTRLVICSIRQIPGGPIRIVGTGLFSLISFKFGEQIKVKSTLTGADGCIGALDSLTPGTFPKMQVAR